MDIETIITPGLGNSTHVIASDGEAVVVDPPRDAWRVSEVAEARGWRVTHVLETHVHNDYLSGALELRAAWGSAIVAPAAGRYAFEHRGVEPGDRLEVGSVRFQARATPGHTPEHLAWDVSDASRGEDGIAAVLTGGSLLVGSAGRTDLLGRDRADELSQAQYESLQALAALPDEVAVLPTHGAGSFCSTGPSDGGRTSTIGSERASNPLLGVPDLATFRRIAGSRLGGYPRYYAEMAHRNRAGPPVVGRPPLPSILAPEAFSAALAQGAVAVDGRRRREFAAGHIPGSLGIELGDTFASYVGWFVPFGAGIALILPDPAPAAIEEAVVQLFRIGYDQVVGVLEDGMDAWTASGRPVRAYETTTVEAMHQSTLAGRDGYTLDVREPWEWRDEGMVPGAIRVPIGDLPDHLAALPRDAPVTVLCRTGARASIAASLLDMAGVDVRLVARGGAPDWPRQDDPASEAATPS